MLISIGIWEFLMISPATTERTKIDLGTHGIDLIMALSNGNPGAMNAMNSLLLKFPTPNDLYLDIDDMNLRGPRLAAAFHVAERNVEKFENLVRARDQNLVTEVNQLAGGAARSQQAMCRGGSNL